MKSRFLSRVIACSLSFVALFSVSVSAANLGVISGTEVNIRNGSSTDSSVIRKGNNNEVFTVTASHNGWYKVNGNGITGGFINFDFFKITSADAQVAGNGVNIRKAPSKSAEIITSMNLGAPITITEQTGDWYSFNYNNTPAYIYKEYVKGTFISGVPEVSQVETSQKKSETVTEATTQATTQAPKASVEAYAPAGSGSTASGEELVAYAKQFVGTPYIYGGTNLNSGVDCSGFTYSVYNSFGISLNRRSCDQISNGTPVSTSNLSAGDLVFFNTGGNSKISHVGMYIGNGQYIHSTDSKGKGVTIDSLSSAYAKNTYYGACRVLS